MAYTFNPFTGNFDFFERAAATVSSVSNSDGTLTISPTTGDVVASLDLSNANTWTGQQTFDTASPIFGTMTEGSVLFAGAGGLLSQDNANFFWDDSNNRLSIGNPATQTFRLNVEGSLRVSSATTNAICWFTSGSADGDYAQMVYGQSSIPGQYTEFVRFSNATTSAPGYFYLFNESHPLILTTQYSLGYLPNLAIDTSGRVGIGTLSVGAQQHVVSQDSARIGQIVQGAASQSANLQEFQNSSGTVLSNFNHEASLALGDSSPAANNVRFNIRADNNHQAFTVTNVDSLGGQTHFGITTGEGALGTGNSEYWNSYKDANGWIFNTTKTGSGTTRRMRWLINDSTLAWVINSDARVGNVLSPGAQLEINAANASTKVAIFKAAATPSANIVEFQDSAAAAKVYIDTSFHLNFAAQGQARFQDSAGGEYAAIRAPATIGASYTLTLPTTDGNAGEQLTTDGSGVLSWTAPTGSMARNFLLMGG